MHAYSYEKARGTKGDLSMTTSLEMWNACLLNALALPALPRLGRCPTDLRLRPYLNTIETYDEQDYYVAVNKTSVAGSGSSTSANSVSTNEYLDNIGGGSSSISGGQNYTNSSNAHLRATLTRTQLLHFSRRVGYSPVSMNFIDHIMPANATTTDSGMLRRQLDGQERGSAVAPETEPLLAEQLEAEPDLEPSRVRRNSEAQVSDSDASFLLTNPKITLQQAISKVLTGPAAIASNLIVDPPKAYNTYLIRKHGGIGLWSAKRRTERNNWQDVMQLPYPRYDPIERRLKRWKLEKYFDLSSITVDSMNDYHGSISIKPAYVGKEIEILNQIQQEGTVFYQGRPVSKKTGKIDKKVLVESDDGGGVFVGLSVKPEKASEINWYATVMQATDVKSIIGLTGAAGVQKILDDWKCTSQGEMSMMSGLVFSGWW